MRFLPFVFLLAAALLFYRQSYPSSLVFEFPYVVVLNALLVHAFFISYFILSAFRWIPMAYIAIPLLAYGAYYFAFFEQWHIVSTEVRRETASNKNTVLSFDASSQSLLVEDVSKAELILENYEIPLIYFSSGVMRLLTPDQCNQIGNPNIHGVGITILYRPSIPKDATPCILDILGKKPLTQTVEIKDVDRSTTFMRFLGIREPSIEVLVDGRLAGPYQTLEVQWMHSALYAMGCGLVDNPAEWACSLGFSYYKEAFIFDLDRSSDYELKAKLVGLTRLPDLKNFNGYAENADSVSLAQKAIEEARKKRSNK